MIQPAINYKPEIKSHRKFLGFLTTWVRNKIHDEIRLAIEPIISNQERVNQQLIDQQNRLKEYHKPLKIPYFKFENQFRGDENIIKARQGIYTNFFKAVDGKIVDIGCGRGEFLELCRDNNIRAYGVDNYPPFIQHCKNKKLNVLLEDANEHLEKLPDQSLAGVFSAQVIEHFSPRYLTYFIKLCHQKLKTHGIIILETLNPLTNWDSFIKDLSHKTPLHPDTLCFLLRDAGFKAVKWRQINDNLDFFVFGLKE